MGWNVVWCLLTRYIFVTLISKARQGSLNEIHSQCGLISNCWALWGICGAKLSSNYYCSILPSFAVTCYPWFVSNLMRFCKWYSEHVSWLEGMTCIFDLLLTWFLNCLPEMGPTIQGTMKFYCVNCYWSNYKLALTVFLLKNF